MLRKKGPVIGAFDLMNEFYSSSLELRTLKTFSTSLSEYQNGPYKAQQSFNKPES